MPKYDLITNEIKWCEENRNPEQKDYQDGFIAGLRHALFLMKSRSMCEHGYNGLCPTCDAMNTPPLSAVERLSA
jgi:hypothetical protein